MKNAHSLPLREKKRKRGGKDGREEPHEANCDGKKTERGLRGRKSQIKG